MYAPPADRILLCRHYGDRASRRYTCKLFNTVVSAPVNSAPLGGSRGAVAREKKRKDFSFYLFIYVYKCVYIF